MNFEKVDYIPLWDFGFLPETLESWYNEGLSRNVSFSKIFGTDKSFEDYIVPIKWDFVPQFEEINTGDTGISEVVFSSEKKIRRFREGIGFDSVQQFLEYPIKNKSDFSKIVKRLNPLSAERYPENWDNYKNSIKNRDYPLGIHCGGFFSWAEGLMGIENLSNALYNDKSLIMEMFDFRLDFTLKLIEKAVKELDIDFAVFFEDMAYSKGSLISPKLFKRFLSKRYRKISDFLHFHKIDLIFMDCDGNVDELVPLWLEAGINGIYPLEVQSGNNPRKFRNKYGKNILLMGGIDRNVLLKNKELIESEVNDKRDLISFGGYIPFLDYRVSPEVPLKKYLYYLELMKGACKVC